MFNMKTKTKHPIDVLAAQIDAATGAAIKSGVSLNAIIDLLEKRTANIRQREALASAASPSLPGAMYDGHLRKMS